LFSALLTGGGVPKTARDAAFTTLVARNFFAFFFFGTDCYLTMKCRDISVNKPSSRDQSILTVSAVGRKSYEYPTLHSMLVVNKSDSTI
jgi:hypothetical protein